jgi:uncharacterized integral membrane protein (TIGR00698 family)
MPEPAPRPPREQIAAAAVIVGAAASAIPGVPAAAALAGGIAIALVLGNPLAAHTRKISKRLLPASVVGLGGAMDLVAVGRAGLRGVGYTITTIAACMALGALLARALRVERRTGLLVTVGTAICGGSAIAAAAPVLGADDRELSVALGTVFVLNSVALVVFPGIGHAVGLGEPAFGLWAALAIHDTSSVVGAALQYGPTALSVATTVKLARALWIVPLTLGLGALERARSGAARQGRSQPPWFILGFLVAAALATFVPALRPAGHLVAAVAQRALVVTLFLVGVGLSREGLRAVGPRPLALGLALWVAMGVSTLAAVKAGLGV